MPVKKFKLFLVAIFVITLCLGSNMYCFTAFAEDSGEQTNEQQQEVIEEQVKEEPPPQKEEPKKEEPVWQDNRIQKIEIWPFGAIF